MPAWPGSPSLACSRARDSVDEFRDVHGDKQDYPLRAGGAEPRQPDRAGQTRRPCCGEDVRFKGWGSQIDPGKSGNETQPRKPRQEIAATLTGRHRLRLRGCRARQSTIGVIMDLILYSHIEHFDARERCRRLMAAEFPSAYRLARESWPAHQEFIGQKRVLDIPLSVFTCRQ